MCCASCGRPIDQLFASSIMKHRFALALSLLTAAIHVCQATQAATIIHAGRLIDGRAAEARTEATLVIDDAKIVRIEAGYVPSEQGDTVLDFRRATVLPGLIDLHTH